MSRSILINLTKMSKYMDPTSHGETSQEINLEHVTVAELTDHLWRTLLQETRPLEIHDGCERDLRAIIEHGAARMLQRPATSGDLALARVSVTRLVGLLKHHAILLGHPDWLGEDTLQKTTELLGMMRFELWPFWPW